MSDTTDTSVDFSNVSLSDFGKLSPAQKLGFLITLPIALPVLIVVKFFQLFPADDNQDGVLQEPRIDLVTPDPLDSRVLGDADWHADEMAYGEMIADMNVDAANNGTAL